MASQHPHGLPYTDAAAFARQTGIGAVPPGGGRKARGGLNRASVAVASVLVMTTLSALFLALTVADALRGRATVDAIFRPAGESAHTRRQHQLATIAREFDAAPLREDVVRLRGFVPDGVPIAAISMNSGRRLSAIAVRGASAMIYDANGRDKARYQWLSRDRSAAPGVELEDFDPAAPARIIEAVTALPGFSADGMTSLTLAHDPRADGALRWTATWAFDLHAIFTADPDGRGVRRELRAAGAPA